MKSDDQVLRSRLIRLASEQPELRAQILPLLKTAKYDRVDLIQELGDLVSFVDEAHDKIEEHLDGAPPEVAKYIRGCLKACTDLSGAAETAQETAQEPEKPVKKKAAIRGFDGMVTAIKTLDRDLESFADQLDADTQDPHAYAFKMLYKGLVAAIGLTRSTLTNLLKETAKVQAGLSRS